MPCKAFSIEGNSIKSLVEGKLNSDASIERCNYQLQAIEKFYKEQEALYNNDK